MTGAKATTRRLKEVQQSNPEEWMKRVREVLEQTRRVKVAAKKLGVGAATLHRLIKQNPALVEGITLRKRGNPGIDKRRPECECHWLYGADGPPEIPGHLSGCPREPEDRGQVWNLFTGQYEDSQKQVTCPHCLGKGFVLVPNVVTVEEKQETVSNAVSELQKKSAVQDPP